MVEEKKSLRYRDGDSGSWKSTSTHRYSRMKAISMGPLTFAPSPLKSTERDQFSDLLLEDRL